LLSDKKNIDKKFLQEAIVLVQGMTCGACSARVGRVLEQQNGVSEAAVNLATGQARILFDSQTVRVENLLAAVNNAGFDASLPVAAGQSLRESNWPWVLWLAIALSFPMLIIMFLHMAGVPLPAWLFSHWLYFVLATPVQFVCAVSLYKGAWHSLKGRAANMDVLVAVATSVAYFYSVYSMIAGEQNVYFETSAMLITFILLGKSLENATKIKATAAVRALADLRPPTAKKVFENGKEEIIPLNQVVVGDVLRVAPGEKVPADGVVLDGLGVIDEAMLTGESRLIEKNPGDLVIGATLNQNGTMLVKVEKVGEATTLARIIDLVERAQSRPAHAQRLADRAANIFVPVVLLLSVLTFLLSYFVLVPGILEQALFRAVAVLVVACPCALGLATPMAVITATGRGAAAGILYKGGVSLEEAGQVKTVIMDKTGTITNGHPQVVGTKTAADAEAAWLLWGAAVGRLSGHPLALAIANYVEEEQLAAGKDMDWGSLIVTDFVNIPGKGVKAKLDGHEILFGNATFLALCGIALPPEAEIAEASLVLVAIDAKWAGTIALADQIRPKMAEAIKEMQQMGLQVVMCTGDNAATAKKVAASVGIEKVEADLLPEDKSKIVEKWQVDKQKVAMVGDGINDAPALALADLGIAMGSGSQIAQGSADVTLLSADPWALVRSLKLGRRTVRIIWQNLFWAFSYNILMIPLAMLGVISPIFAGAAMAFSSLSVCLNSLRIYRVKID